MREYATEPWKNFAETPRLVRWERPLTMERLIVTPNLGEARRQPKAPKHGGLNSRRTGCVRIDSASRIKISAAGFTRLGRLSGGRPTIYGVVQLTPFAIPAQFAKSVIGDPHSIIFSQAKSAARQPHTAEGKRNGVSEQLALGEGHFPRENE